MAVNNYLWNYLPEIVAATSNSPVYLGRQTGVVSNRYLHSTVLKPNGPARIELPDDRPALVPMQYYGRRRYRLKIGTGDDVFSQKVMANLKGSRLVDITPRGPSTNIVDDKDDSPVRNRVEVRVIDMQQEVSDLLDVAYLICSSALHAVELDETGTMHLDRHHDSNLKEAFTKGSNAVFKRDGGGEEGAKESIAAWVRETAPARDYLGVKIGPLESSGDLRKPHLGCRPSVAYNTPEIDKLRKRGTLVVVKLGRARIVSDTSGRQYKVKAGTSIDGTLSVDYSLSYEEDEDDGLVTCFKSLDVTNTLDVRGLLIPLEAGDEVVRVIEESDYLLNRLLGSLGF